MRPVVGLNFGGKRENPPLVMFVCLRSLDIHRGFKVFKLGFYWSPHPEPVPVMLKIYRKSFVFCFQVNAWREF